MPKKGNHGRQAVKGRLGGLTTRRP